MTPDQIEMLKRLKAPIDKYMGEWKEGDLGYIGNELVMIVEIGEYCIRIYSFRLKQVLVGNDDNNILRIPPFCTPDGKRCLWDSLSDENKNKLLNSMINYPSVNNINDFYNIILKALCEQEGV